MPEERVINTTRPADLVTHKILVDGEELSAVYSVLNITVEKELNRVSSATIVMIDGDPAAQEFALSNQDLLVPGKELEILAGYHADEEAIFKGIVIKHALKVRGNQSFLTVECKDKSVKLTAARKSKYFYESRDSEILEQIFDAYGLEKQVETTDVQHAEQVQYNVTDWDYCVARAQANGKLCIPDDGKIIVKAPDYDQEPVQTVAYGATLLDFDAEMDARNQFKQVKAYAWNKSEQSVLEIDAADASMSLNGNLSKDELAEVIDVEALKLKDGGNIFDTALQAWADAKSLFNALAKTRGRMKFQGIAAVKPDTTINLEGVGDRFSGKVYISAVRHEIAQGNWTVDAQFGIDPEWFTEKVNINAQQASGLTAAVHGLQVGVVTQLEGDPDGEDRILVRLPIVDNEEQGIWARIATLDAGENRGSFFRPEIDDEVIVGFVNDNPNDAVVLGMMNSSANPAPFTASDDNHEKGFVTRSGMKVVFNDDKKSIDVETPAGKKVKIDEDGGVIQVEDENGNKTLLDADGITLESAANITLKATQDVTIEGMNVSVKANAQLKAESSAGSEVSSSANTVIKGAIVQIN